MKSFLELQNVTPTYFVICEALTTSELAVKFEFKVHAINEKCAEDKANEVVKEMNLKNVKQTLKRV